MTEEQLSIKCDMVRVQAEALEQTLERMNKLQGEIVEERASDRVRLLSLQSLVRDVVIHANIAESTLITALLKKNIFFRAALRCGTPVEEAESIERAPSLFDQD